MRFHIEAGGRPRLDLQLSPTPAFPLQVAGMVRPPSGTPSTGTMWSYYALERNDATAESVLIRDDINLPGDAIEIPNVASGRYVVEAGVLELDGPGSIARQEIEVTDEAPAPIKLQPVAGATVQVHLRGLDGNSLDDQAATVSFVPSDPRLRVRQFQHSTASALDPGAYWLSVNARPPFCAASASRAAGQNSAQDILRDQLVLAPGSAAVLDIRLTKQCGTINLLTTTGAQPLPFSNFLLLLSGKPESPGGAITGSSDANGRVSIGPLTPGDYLIWAWSSNKDGYIGPELSDAANQASQLTVTAGQATLLSMSPTSGGSPR
jgi:hypothetical protein